MKRPTRRHLCEFKDIRIPPRSAADARAAVLNPEGCAGYLAGQEHRFLLLNPVEAALAMASDAKAEAARLGRAVENVGRKLAWTPATIAGPRQPSKIGWRALALGLGLSGVGGTGMVVSNLVLSNYVLASAASDLFAGNPLHATLFATLPCLGAVALKVFEQQILGANARWLFGAIAFAVGILSLAVWLAASAMAFAPDMAGVAGFLTEGRGGNAVGMALLLSTVLCDIALGFTILSGIAALLSPGTSEAIANPAHAALRQEQLRLERSIARCRRQHATAQDYLARAEAGRALTRHEAEHDLDRARELWVQAKGAVHASAAAHFLSTGSQAS
jgi:predicted transcriptional regulator